MIIMATTLDLHPQDGHQLVKYLQNEIFLHQNQTYRNQNHHSAVLTIDYAFLTMILAVLA